MSGVYMLLGRRAGWGRFTGGGGAACASTCTPSGFPGFRPHTLELDQIPTCTLRLRMGRVLPSPLSLPVTPPPHPPPARSAAPRVPAACRASAGPREAWVEKATFSWGQSVVGLALVRALWPAEGRAGVSLGFRGPCFVPCSGGEQGLGGSSRTSKEAQ